ncbi:MAG: acetyltransferase [Comamonadaceae bacterium PBBC2]|nr:MAG: acetyltransferase [Comamonadaceae bacterium PBBC2]
MLFKFKSAAASDLIMHEADGRKLLKIMLGDDPVKGIVLAADIPARIAALEAAVAKDEALRQQQAEQAASDQEDDEAVVLDAVRLSQRATPMLKLLARSLAEKSDVVWGV